MLKTSTTGSRLIEPASMEAAPVLLVEDVEVNRKVATAILTKAGYRVESAANGLEALTAVTAGPYGLILMDLAMPVMDGLEATRRIRALPGEGGRTPIVAMTAGTFDEDRPLCLASGMNDFISKPVVKAELLAAVRRWLLGHDEGMDRAPNVSAPHDGIAETLLSEETLTDLNDNLGMELVPRMIQGFLGELERRIDRLLDAIQAQNLVEASADAHSLKGSAGTFGAAALQEGARRLELACRAQDMTTVQVLLPMLIATAQRTRLMMQSRYGLPESV
jgi:two-component system, sensor histidine kinase and response regulator